MNFDPFIDYESVTEEMAGDLHAAIRAHREAVNAFVDDPEPSIEKARAVLEAANTADATYRAVMQSLYTQPVLVHKAGPRKTEQHPDDPMREGIFQRCERCGSVLNFWHEGIMFLSPQGPRQLEEDDVPWWGIGDIVAKSNTDDGVGMYEIDPKRPLEKHERECVALNDLIGE